MARWARAIPQLLLISLAMFGVSAALPFLLLTLVPGGLGQIALLAGPLAGLHFLVFAPVTAIVDGTSYRDAIRFSARAARLPGKSHLALTFAYFALAMFAASALPPFGQATPTVGTWAIVLLVTFLHVMVLAAFVYRWFAVRDVVPKGPATPRPRPTRGGARPARPGGLLGRFGR